VKLSSLRGAFQIVPFSKSHSLLSGIYIPALTQEGNRVPSKFRFGAKPQQGCQDSLTLGLTPPGGDGSPKDRPVRTLRLFDRSYDPLNQLQSTTSFSISYGLALAPICGGPLVGRQN